MFTDLAITTQLFLVFWPHSHSIANYFPIGYPSFHYSSLSFGILNSQINLFKHFHISQEYISQVEMLHILGYMCLELCSDKVYRIGRRNWDTQPSTWEYHQRSDPMDKLKSVEGHLVCFPFDFKWKEDLFKTFLQWEYILRLLSSLPLRSYLASCLWIYSVTGPYEKNFIFIFNQFTSHIVYGKKIKDVCIGRDMWELRREAILLLLVALFWCKDRKNKVIF